MTSQTAHRAATTTEITEMAEVLQRDLGQRAVAYAVGVKSPRLVGRWAAGHQIGPENEQRLRDLFRVHAMLADQFSGSVIRAWLVGLNPDLDDRAPLELLHEEDALSVFHAAEAFAAA